MDSGLRPPRSAYFGIGLLSFVLLGSQLVLTRIFSVILWYHFAFLVVSLVMLGMAAGGSLVYALPRRFTPETVFRRVAYLSATSGLLLFAGIVIVLVIPGNPLGLALSHAGTGRAVLVALTLLPSFIAAGIVIAALFDAFPNAVPTLYAADLLGAGLGAVVALWLMWQLSGPSLGLLMGALLIGSGTFFAAGGGHARLRTQLALLCALLIVASLANDGLNLVRVRHTKTISLEALASSEATANLTHERWSPIAYVTVFDNYIFAKKGEKTFAGWGVGSKYLGTPPPIYHLLQDATGGSLITLWDGDVSKVTHLDYDVSALPYRLRRFDTVLIVGPGGGRDVLAALRGEASEIVAVEMNPDIIDLMTNELRGFSGELYLRPEVELVAAEARSWLTRTSRSFDLIQLSLIDSWAATAAGAMVFAENNLYTVEAFELYLDHLNAGGVLSISRWFTGVSVTDPDQTLKVVSIAAEALRRRGIEDPSQHIIVARGGILGTVLISKRPFSSQDYEAAVRAMGRYGLHLVYASGHASRHREFVQMLTPGNTQAYIAAQPIDLRPVDDDRPFFFVLSKGLFSPLPARYSHHNAALKLLAWLIGSMALLGTLLVIGPLLLRTRLAGTSARGLRRSVRPLLYFVGLGAGFMLVEITLLQRLIVYLGHPTYAATIVLTTLLISLGLGSAIVSRQDAAISLARQRSFVAAGMLIVLAVALVGPTITSSSQGAPLPLRVGLAAVMLTLVGVPLGTLLPTGMRRLIAVELDSLIPWAWAVNGVAGVIFSAMALLLAIHWGYTLCLLIGVGFYALSLISIPARTTAQASPRRT